MTTTSKPVSERTSRVPSYEGRRLPRPDDEVVDQGLSFDMVTLSRRRMLGILGAGTGAMLLAACGGGSAGTTTSATSPAPAASGAASTTGLTEIPEETAGPYPGDGTNGPDVLSESGIVRSDIRSSFGSASATAEGVPFVFELTVLDMVNNGDPFKNVAVYAWHCDRDGNYSMYSDAIADQNYLRGVQVTDADGKVRFTSIFPACYSGRWPHVHFEVYPSTDAIDDASNAIATSQLALPKSVLDKVYATSGYEQSVKNLSHVSLSSDNVFGNDSAAHQMATVTGDVTDGYTAALTVPIDTSTAAGGGGAAQGGAPGGGPPDMPAPNP